MKFLCTVLLLLFFSIGTYGEETIRILAIGNSFSEDAVEEYLDDLARTAGLKVIIGNACIGGSSLEKHWNNAQGDSAAYSYRKINEMGEKTVFPQTTLLDCIADENWDYITLQQYSGSSGQNESFFPYLPSLIGYVREHATNPGLRLALHQTWAYARDSKHSWFPKYDNDQEKMYQAIVNAVSKAASATGIDLIIPAGTAIQNARVNMGRDDFCRDGYHLDKGIGRYAAACAWYETLLGKPVTDNLFCPETVPEADARLIRQAAHEAVREPGRTALFGKRSGPDF